VPFRLLLDQSETTVPDVNDAVTRPKPDLERSEAWLSALSGVGALVAAYTARIEGAATWVALGVCVVLTAVYAFFRTPLAAEDRPGVRTKAFWTSIIVVLASVATAISEAAIAGIPPKVTQAAGMIAAAAVAMGYNVWRYKAKSR